MKSSQAQDAGWNDPPKFSYSESVELTSSPKRNILNKRVAFPLNSKSLKPTTSFLDPTAPPSNNPNLPPPPSTFSYPNEQDNDTNLGRQLPNLDNLNISTEKTEHNTNTSEIIKIDISEIISSLKKIIEEKRLFFTENREELIKKKLLVMKESWEADKLSDSIKKRISELTNALKENHKETANQIQVALMVDHPKPCSEFISAFRQLINIDESNS